MKTFVWVLFVLVVLAVAGSVAWRFLARDDGFQFDRKSLRLEVVNGCGIPRVGRAIADDLVMRGYDVYGFATSDKHYRRTVVIDLRDRRCRGAGKVARSLRVQRRLLKMRIGRPVIPDTAVEVDSSRFAQIRLVVGDDYRVFFPRVLPLH